jgi:hypothetical protein
MSIIVAFGGEKLTNWQRCEFDGITISSHQQGTQFSACPVDWRGSAIGASYVGRTRVAVIAGALAEHQAHKRHERNPGAAGLAAYNATLQAGEQT